MSGNFNGQILVEKLSKLNSSQQSIETLSHWCIFHRKNAKQVVETWDRQFHCSSRDRRVPFLYLANDILQNSRRKGSEFVVEFWKILSDALSDVLKNGDESDRRAAMRLIDIWEERKVFGSSGQALKEELLGKNREEHNKIGSITQKSKNSHREELEKIFSSYDHVYSSSVDEDAVLRKCQDAISSVEKLEKNIRNDPHSGSSIGSETAEDLQRQHSILREAIEKLKTAELSRAVLVSNLREALRGQDLKLQHVRDQLQTAQMAFETAGSLCEQRMNQNNGQLPSDSRPKEVAQTSDAPTNYVHEPQVSNGEREKAVPVTYTPQIILPENPPQSEDDDRKSAAAAVAAKLAASTSSAQMLSYVLSSLASEGVIGQQRKEDNAAVENKRAKLDNGSPYAPTLSMQQQQLPPPQQQQQQHQQQPPLPPPPPPPPAFPHPDSLKQMVPPQPPAMQLSAPLSSSSINLQVPPVSLPPLQPPLHPNQFMQNAGSMTGVPYSYGSAPQLQPPLPLPSYQVPGVAPFPGGGSMNSFHNPQVTESSSLSNHPPLPGTAPPAFSHQ